MSKVYSVPSVIEFDDSFCLAVLRPAISIRNMVRISTSRFGIVFDQQNHNNNNNNNNKEKHGIKGEAS